MAYRFGIAGEDPGDRLFTTVNIGLLETRLRIGCFMVIPRSSGEILGECALMELSVQPHSAGSNERTAGPASPYLWIPWISLSISWTKQCRRQLVRLQWVSYGWNLVPYKTKATSSWWSDETD